VELSGDIGTIEVIGQSGVKVYNNNAGAAKSGPTFRCDVGSRMPRYIEINEFCISRIMILARPLGQLSMLLGTRTVVHVDRYKIRDTARPSATAREPVPSHPTTPETPLVPALSRNDAFVGITYYLISRLSTLPTQHLTYRYIRTVIAHISPTLRSRRNILRRPTFHRNRLDGIPVIPILGIFRFIPLYQSSCPVYCPLRAGRDPAGPDG
jgi:hypothetical protein